MIRGEICPIRESKLTASLLLMMWPRWQSRKPLLLISCHRHTKITTINRAIIDENDHLKTSRKDFSTTNNIKKKPQGETHTPDYVTHKWEDITVAEVLPKG